MYKGKLVEVFYSLSKGQLRRLKKFVRSPYFNKREDVVDLFDLMLKTPLSNRIALRKEKVFKKLYPNEAFDADKLDYTMSFLFKTIEDFLIHENRTEDKTQNTIALLQEYRTLGLAKHFQQNLRAAQKLQKTNKLRDFRYYRQDFEIEMEKFYYIAAKQRNTSKNLQEVSTKLDLVFLNQKLKDACQLLAHQAVYKQQYEFGLLDNILAYVQDNLGLLDEHPSIALYYYYYHAATQPENEAYFQNFKSVFAAYHEVFEDDELRDFYTLALNYCVRKINLGQPRYQEELFQFYEAGLALKLLIEHNYLSPFKFTNITKLALRLGKVEWTQQFIEDYKGLVDIQYHSTYIHDAYSMLYFAQGKYQKTMEHLQQVEYKDLFITLNSKIILTKVYYHLEEYDVLESHINSLKVFVRRKDILAYHREIYQNFIRYTQKIIQVSPFDKSARQKLHTEITNTKKILDKQWLLSLLE